MKGLLSPKSGARRKTMNTRVEIQGFLLKISSQTSIPPSNSTNRENVSCRMKTTGLSVELGAGPRVFIPDAGSKETSSMG